MLGFVGERTEVMEGVGNISICVNVSTEDFEGPVEVLVEYTSISAQGMEVDPHYLRLGFSVPF